MLDRSGLCLIFDDLYDPSLIGKVGNPILRAFGYWFLLALLVLAILSFVGSVYQDVPDISWYWRLALLRNALGFAVPICGGSVRKVFCNIYYNYPI